jgi:hypothetical protein
LGKNTSYETHHIFFQHFNFSVLFSFLLWISPFPSGEHRVSTLKAAPLLKRLVIGFPPRRPEFEPSGQVGFLVDKVALGQIFSEYFNFTCQSSFHQILHSHNHPGQVQ